MSIPHGVSLALRQLRRRPLYPMIALVILSLGLSAAISAFTYINSFSQPFPGADSDRLVRVFGSEEGEPFVDISFLDYLDYAEAVEGFESLAAVQPYYAASVRHEEMTEVAFVEAVTGTYFEVLGNQPEIGRFLTPDDDRLEVEQAAVISYEWWQSRYDGDPGVLGQTLFLNYRPSTIVGVAARDFVGSSSDFRPHVWIPIAHFRDRYVSWDRMALDRDVPLVRVFGRLAGGDAGDRAGEGLTAAARNLDQAYPRAESPRDVHLQAATWIDPRTRIAEASTNRIMVFAAGGFLLLVCANVANLLLALFSTRKREFALHAALGATPSRILRGIVGQNVALSLTAGLVALGLAVPLSARLGSYFARPSVWGENVPRELSLDSRVVLFAIGVAVLTGVLAAILPALDALRRDVSQVLKSDLADRAYRGRVFGVGMPTNRELLMAAQVALAMVLIVVSGLVLKTLSAASEIDPGFEYTQLIGSHVSTSSTGVQPEGREQFFLELERRISEEPWVRSATVSGNAPLSGHGSVRLRVEGGVEDVVTVVDQVHRGFFQKLDIRLVGGRTFSEADSSGGARVAILNGPAASRLFPGESVLGRRVSIQGADGGETSFEVVGTVGDVKVRDFIAPPEPAIYLPYAQQSYPTGSALLVNVSVPPELAVPLLHRWLREFEPHLAIVNAITYKDVVSGALYTQRRNAELFTALAVLGLVLAFAGIFSVVSLSVARRRREIGVRKAVGATAGTINLLIVRQTMVPVLLGGAVGLGLSSVGGKLLASLLYGVEPTDPAVFAGGLGVLLLGALLAAYGPAFRASRIDAVEALRAE